MRVTFVLPMFSPLPIGGFRVVFEHADHLARDGHSVSIVFPRRMRPERKSLLALLKDLRWWVARWSARRPLRWHTFDPSVRLRYVKDLDHLGTIKGDAVIATSWETAGPVHRLASEAGRKTYLIQHYETWTGSKDDVDATLLLPMRLIVIARWLEETVRDLGAQDVWRITNGIDLEKFRVLNPVEGRPMRVVSMNHAEGFKGVNDAVTALQVLRARVPSVQAVMFGTMARTRDIPDWVEYFENPSQEVLARDVYNSASVYLGASTVEGWGLPPAEAMACGCAFVGTDIGGFAEFAAQGRNALLSAPGDPAGLAKNLERLARDPAERVRMQRDAVEEISRFTWDRASGGLLAGLTADPRHDASSDDVSSSWRRSDPGRKRSS